MIKISLFLAILIISSGCDLILKNEETKGYLRIENITPFEVDLIIDNESEIILQPDEEIERNWVIPDNVIKIIPVEFRFSSLDFISVNLSVTGNTTTTFRIDEKDGYLKIRNITSREIWFQIENKDEIILASGDSRSFFRDLAEGEQMEINIPLDGYHVFEDVRTVTILAGATALLEIVSNGGGVRIWNDLLEIVFEEIYISPSEYEEWGSNQLTGLFEPGESLFHTVDPSLWDFKAIDEEGLVYFSLDNFIALDETSVFYISDWDRSEE